MNKFKSLTLLTTISIFAVFSLSAAEKISVNDWNDYVEDSIINQGQADSNYYTKESFTATFSGATNVTPEIIDRAWTYYLDENWPQLEELFDSNDIASGGTIWPPANGGFNTMDNVQFKKGQMFDRYGSTYPSNYTSGVPNLIGSFTSPILNGKPYTFSQRALKGVEEDYDFYFTIEVLQDLDFTCEEADVIPWFNMPGLATQEKWMIPKDPNSGYPYSFTQLANMGLIRITIISSPSGKYPQVAGTVIEAEKK